MYYRNALGSFIVCDNTNPESLKNVEKWKHQLEENVPLPNGKALPVILLVNKSDITENGIQDSDIDAMCEKCGISTWIRVCLGA